jgi:hypothetical protein
MCKKLMFLISFVALLGLANVAFADIDWICPGASCSFCDPTAWDGGVVPGVGDAAYIDCGNGSGDVVIDCDVHIYRLRGPAYDDDDCNQNMDIVSGDIVIDNYWRAIYNYTKDSYVHATGGSMTINYTGDAMRLTDDGQDDTYGRYTFGGDFVLDCAGRLRSGDNGGNVFLTFEENVIANLSRYARIGDDGGGVFTAQGNASITVGNELYFVCRKMSTDVQIHGNCEIYVEEDFRLGNPGQAAGKAPTSATMTMSGGTLNADRVRLGWDPYPDFIECTLDMSGGLIVARDDVQVGEKTTVSLTGGEIRIDSGDSLEIDDGGTIDICGGELKIKGNVALDIAEMVCDGSGKITGCGAPQGVIIEYDGTYTVVTGTPDYDPDQAYCLTPPCGAERVRSVVTEVELCWQPGAKVGTRGRHLVYFGSDCDAVEAAGPGDPENVCVNRADDLCCNVGNLPLWECFCWRVDEFNQDGTTTTGKMCSFCTGCEDITGDCNRDCLLNFEDYATTVDDFGEQIYWP